MPTAIIRLNRNRPGTLLTDEFLGFSLEKAHLLTPSYLHPANTALINTYRLLGPRVMRIGANSVDRMAWRAPPGELRVNPEAITNMALFAAAVDWKVVYAINFVGNTPSNAAEEAAFAAQAFGSRLLGFEFGNEVDVYAQHGRRPSSWGYSDFLREWRAYRDAVRVAVPQARFVGPSTASPDNLSFPLSFARDEGANIVQLTHHYYIQNGLLPDSTIEKMIQPDPSHANILGQLVPAARAISGGFVLNEGNSYWNSGAPGVSNSYASALWVIDYLCRTANSGCRGAYLHCQGTGQGYAPLIVVAGVLTEVRPEFYGLLLFSRGATGTALPTATTLYATRANFTAYGVDRPDGGVNIFLVNKDPTTTVKVSLDLGVTARAMKQTTLKGSALNAYTGQTLGGSEITTSGIWTPAAEPDVPVTGTTVALDAPPLTAILLQSLA